jgi:hypothetical protein
MLKNAAGSNRAQGMARSAAAQAGSFDCNAMIAMAPNLLLSLTDVGASIALVWKFIIQASTDPLAQVQMALAIVPLLSSLPYKIGLARFDAMRAANKDQEEVKESITECLMCIKRCRGAGKAGCCGSSKPHAIWSEMTDHEKQTWPIKTKNEVKRATLVWMEAGE